MRPSLFRRLARDERGISAVEFALLAPVLIAFYFGMVEFCQGYMAHKRMGHVASAVADLVAQEETVNRDTLDRMFGIGGLIMKPFSTTTLQQRVSSVTMTNNRIVLDWSRGSGGMAAWTSRDTITIPAGLIENGQSLVIATATYDYNSPADYLIPESTKFTHTYYLRPRNSEMTTCSNC